jgi:hypothetical protein
MARVVVTDAAVQALRGLIDSHSLPADSVARIGRPAAVGNRRRKKQR